ncbi:MAG TPA: FAD/NAD(P)-binding oxidoreductase [Solirubrobacterales bacterium]
MATRVLVLGGGFGGLELATVLSAGFGEEVEVTLIDKGDAFVFGFAKLDLMFGRRTPAEVRLPYRELAKPGVRVLREEVVAIDPEARTATTEAGVREGDFLVLALGADLDVAATPGLAEGGNEFYSVPGAEQVATLLPEFRSGRAVIGICGHPFKCPPAPSETAILLDDYLRERGVREACEISVVAPMPVPVPPSPEASEALLAAFGERGIEFLPGRKIVSLDPARRLARIEGGEEIPFDLFLGVPKHRAPRAVLDSGLAPEGFVAVDPRTLETAHPGVYAIGDVAAVGVPKAGVFAEGAARVVAAAIAARLRGGEAPSYDGHGSCYVEFGAGLVGRVDVDFLSGPKPTGFFQEPSRALMSEKAEFSASRRRRWFGS